MQEKQIIFTLLSIEKEQRRRKAGDKLAGYNVGEKVHKKHR